MRFFQLEWKWTCDTPVELLSNYVLPMDVDSYQIGVTKLGGVRGRGSREWIYFGNNDDSQ